MKQSLRLYILLSLFVCLFVGRAAAQSVVFRHLGVRDGLSSSQVNCVFRDSRGFLWLGTVSGLDRFDGFRFTNYYHTNAPDALPDNNVSDIQEDAEGNLWLHTSRGWCRFDTRTEHFDSQLTPWLSERGISGAVECLCIDGQKNMWLTSYDAGCYYRSADGSTLLLIDEFGTGTEPQIGGAIAESVLGQFWKKHAFGVITTHYQNLKHFAEGHEGVVNGAMLYDRHEMRALFQLQTGRPGSSFAIEIARKTGLPEEVIREASEIVGSDYIQSDKYLQDIVRDKRYWEGKRQTIHQREKSLEQTIQRYEEEIAQLRESRKSIISKAKQEAEELLAETNRRIENTIREIREAQAEKESTRRIREELSDFKQGVEEISPEATDELVSKKIRQIEQRRERREQRKKERAKKPGTTPAKPQAAENKPTPFAIGDSVRIKGLTTVGLIESLQGKMATVVFGDMRTKLRTERLEHAALPKPSETPAFQSVGRQTRETIDDHKLNFKQDIDVRGMRGDEALNAVTYFIDDAILLGMSRVRILHGTGTGILRQLIRQYLATVPNVSHYADEHVQFGGSGITVVDLE